MDTKILGDFQTPVQLAKQVITSLKRSGITWSRVLEPTCGVGNFLEVLVKDNGTAELIGIEVQQSYADEATQKFRDFPSVSVLNKNVFDINLGAELPWKSNGPLLVIGNPPWVTNSMMGALGGQNLPQKSNFKGLRGIEAITGNGNFDIAEFICLKLISDLAQTPATVALLCKTSVARNVIRYAYEAKLPVSSISLKHIDSKFWFDAAVDACLFTFSLNNGISTYDADIYQSLDAHEIETTIGYVDGAFVSNTDFYRQFSFLDLHKSVDNKFVWRAGIKHDASSVMELRQMDGNWINGFGEIVDIEEEYLFPLLKSSDIRGFRGKTTGKGMIVTQKTVGEDTMPLEKNAPKLWRYLTKHRSIFNARKSIIYRSKPSFSVFGVGAYSFAPFKVMVSGFYKNPIFVPVGEIAGKSAVCDDTCYLLAFQTASEAALIAAVLNHTITKNFLMSIAFEDSKRPFTKNLLSRIDISALISLLPKSELENQMNDFGGYLFGSRMASEWQTDFVENAYGAFRIPQPNTADIQIPLL